MSLALSGTLVLAGCGKMGGALLEGWLAGGVAPDRIAAFDPAPPPEVLALIHKHGIRHNPEVAGIADAEVLLCAVKPQIMEEVLPAFRPLMAARPLVVSIAAGRTIASFERQFGDATAVVRTIPNTPAAIGRGITAMTSNRHVSPAQRALAMRLLQAVGEVVEVDDESLIDVATAVSGSGPAYVFYLTECLAEAGRAAGLDAELAMALARATVSGSGELMRESGLAAETLRRNVTSPKGTTHAALEILMGPDGVQPLMTRAIAAATARARELAR